MHDELFSFLENEIANRLKNLNRKFELENSSTKVLLGQVMSRLNKNAVTSLHDAEFRVFSQFGDDGIIQFLINTLNIENKQFIEFGVENYNESNTRFLLESNNWKGLVMDCSEKNIQYIKNTTNYWRHNLTAICSFITAENVNQVIHDAGFTGNIGLLHVDVDGNDYWIWNAISIVQPTIAIIEYNSLFGSERCITIPYSPEFERHKAHYSGLYAGTSLAALCQLANEKGYAFVGCNSAGNNAYFILRDKLKVIRELSCEDGYVLASFREARDENGQLIYADGLDAISGIRGMPVYNTRTKQIEVF